MKFGPQPKYRRHVRVASPVAEEGENEELWRQIQKFARYMSAVPEPNFSRVQEIKDDLRKGKYKITDEMLDETATRLSMRFLKREL